LLFEKTPSGDPVGVFLRLVVCWAHPIRAWCGAESQALLKNYAEMGALQIVCRLCMQARKLLKDYGALFITG
ncbi:hypothetical protein, partial [Janthinobacterium sp. HH104]|uniref:hypothetical protein n=1 Tax=Janthinobacterium sp. HH104 TaxID=1537276 RepID=UPI001585EA57